MLDNHFRKILPYLSGPLLRFYGRLQLHPNLISLAGLAGAVISAFLVTQELFVPAVIVWWAGRIMDGTDGLWARASGQSSGFGAYLDIVLDMKAYSIMLPAFSVVWPEHTRHLLWVMLLYVLCITSALALGMQQAAEGQTPSDNRGLRLGAGLAEGGETGLAYTLMLLFPAWFGEILWIWTVILAATILFRTLLAFRILDGRAEK